MQEDILTARQRSDQNRRMDRIEAELKKLSAKMDKLLEAMEQKEEEQTKEVIREPVKTSKAKKTETDKD